MDNKYLQGYEDLTEMEEKRYVVETDYQGGEFGMGRAYTPEQWRRQAICWCFQDENDEMANELYSMEEKYVLDTIAEVWQLGFREATEEDLQDKECADSLEDYMNTDLDTFFNTMFIPHELLEFIYDINEHCVCDYDENNYTYNVRLLACFVAVYCCKNNIEVATVNWDRLIIDLWDNLDKDLLKLAFESKDDFDLSCSRFLI